MRKTSAVLATLSLALVALTGCTAPSTYNGAVCDREGSAGDIDAVANVTGEVGETPKIEVFSPATTQETSFTDLVVGDGVPLATPLQNAVIEISLFGGESGDEIFTTGYVEDQAPLVSIGHWANQVPAFEQILECATGGSRVLAVVSPEDFGAENLAGFELAQDESVVAVFDILESFPSRASGSLQFNAAQGMPTVVRAPDGRPGIIVPDSAPPTAVEAQTLIKGDGETVAEGDVLLVNYTGVTWAEKTVFDSSWDRGAAVFDLAGLIPGFSEGMVGQTVGSQVLVVVPPEFGYGEAGSGAVPPDSTLVFVVDILAIDPPASPQQ